MTQKSAVESNHEAKTVRLPPGESEQLRYLGALFYRHGWAYATSSNYSVRLLGGTFKLLITASGKDKSSLGPSDFVVVDEKGEALDSSMGKPSASSSNFFGSDVIPSFYQMAPTIPQPSNVNLTTN